MILLDFSKDFAIFSISLQIDGWSNGQTNEWTDQWIDGPMDRKNKSLKQMLQMQQKKMLIFQQILQLLRSITDQQTGGPTDQRTFL